ncbi:MAG: hypothetical protein ACRDJ4_03400 [Actinomycetota bacterium]
MSTAIRRVALAFSLFAWVYSWYLLRGVRFEYAGGLIGDMPPWLILLLAATALATLGTTVFAAMRVGAWPWLAIASGILLVTAIVGSHYGVMASTVAEFERAGANIVGKVGLGNAVQAALRTRGTFHLIVVVVLPTVLLLSGISELVARPPAPVPDTAEYDDGA